MSRSFVFAALLSVAITAPMSAQKPAAKKVDEAAEMKKMKAEARITEATARATALTRVPHSTVSSYELEREGGKLIYSFDLKVAGKTGIDEVHVDAISGKLIGAVEHEAPPAAKKPVKAAAKTGH